jgi:hypothetical protein
VSRRLSPEDFREAAALMKGSHEEGRWWVCESYELLGDAIVAKHSGPEDFSVGLEWLLGEGWRSYKPLEENPDLFLKFARIHEAHDFEAAALAFSHMYGIPGYYLDPDESPVFYEETPSNTRPDRVSLSWWQEESKRMWIILHMYNAVLGKDKEAIQRLILKHDEILEEWPIYLHEGESIPDAPPELALFGALYGVVGKVSNAVRTLCHPGLVLPAATVPDLYTPDPSKVRSTWSFHDLLGAMYLQMYWLVASGGDLTRCEHCGRMISLSRPHPEGRKGRRDKRFCDDACRQAHHRSKKRAEDVSS